MNELRKSKDKKNDEFYTRYEDVEKEIEHYADKLKGKKILCNCNDMDENNAFHKYFTKNFDKLSLSSATFFKYPDVPFDSEIGINEMRNADVIVTNPPFTKFREFINLCIELKKDFIVIGRFTQMTCLDMWRHFMNGNLKFGVTEPQFFVVPPEYEVTTKAKCPEDDRGQVTRVPGCVWYTSFDHNQKGRPIKAKGSVNTLTKLVNYDAYNCNKIEQLDPNSNDVFAVPVTFLLKDYHDTYEIVGLAKGGANDHLRVREFTKEECQQAGKDLNASAVVYEDNQYKSLYTRILIRKNTD